MTHTSKWNIYLDVYHEVIVFKTAEIISDLDYLV